MSIDREYSVEITIVTQYISLLHVIWEIFNV